MLKDERAADVLAAKDKCKEAKEDVKYA